MHNPTLAKIKRPLFQHPRRPRGRKSKRAGKYGTKKSKERREEPLGTMSYQTSSKRSQPNFWAVDFL